MLQAVIRYHGGEGPIRKWQPRRIGLDKPRAGDTMQRRIPIDSDHGGGSSLRRKTAPGAPKVQNKGAGAQVPQDLVHNATV
jgi:hypothetical protein